GLAARGDQRRGEERPHASGRTRGDAALAAPHPRDDARVALPAPHGRALARDAEDGARGHRRRDPRGARVAARCPPRAVARAPRSRLRPPPAARGPVRDAEADRGGRDRKSTRLNSSHEWISYAVFCLKKKREQVTNTGP